MKIPVRFQIPNQTAKGRVARIAALGWMLAAGLSSPAFAAPKPEPETGQGPKIAAATKPKESAKNQKKKANAAPKKSKAGKLVYPRASLAETVLVSAPEVLKHETFQRDFPAGVTAKDGQTWVAYLEHDGQADTLWLAKENTKENTLEPVAAMSEPGILHQPALAVDGQGGVWCFWGQTGDDDIVHLHARNYVNGQLGAGEIVAKSSASDTFADAGTDADGRVWVVWQSMRAGEGDIFCRYYEPGAAMWSEELTVSAEEGGDWEPRIAFDGSGEGAWVVYDSSGGNEFNLYLAHIGLDGKLLGEYPIAHSLNYEARASIRRTADGKGFWIAAERGKQRWGLDNREHNDWNGLNSQRKILFGRFDLDSKTFEEISLGWAGVAVAPGSAVNLPSVGVDYEGHPWVAYRYYDTVLWSIALTRYNPETKTWSQPTTLPRSSLGQDRRACFVRSGRRLRLLWPSDLRTNKTVQVAGVYLAELDYTATLETATAGEPEFEKYEDPHQHLNLGDPTPERPGDDRHEWTFDGQTYGLYWGDFHRHTDVSNCRTGFDGCIVEHFRYAYDMGKLDFLGTSDHTDIGKPYDPYEWWHNQRLADVFFAPGQFTPMYVYEREQRWPWGHRNVVFAERGGPIVYIKRVLYRNSPWQQPYPVRAGLDEISPQELWDILKKTGKPVACVSHTGATGMGTDWSLYDQIDHAVENVVEIYQGARDSYEGIDVPQPPVAIGRIPLDPGAPLATERSKASFGQYSAGVYQNALAQGHQLGVFASSDHLSEHVSYGGVYVKEFTREGIVEALKARRTVAATDKIYVEFSCSGHLLGTTYETSEKPTLRIKVDGTAPIARVTVVRNEANYETFQGDGQATEFEAEFTDGTPVSGENRYYLRVEQLDGNMAWASPVWVTFKE